MRWNPDGSKSRLYTCWQNMKARCSNPNRRDYRWYGAKGIGVCERWQDFDNFAADMAPMPIGHTLERRNVSRDYAPDNCFWLPKKLQSRNMSSTRWVSFGGRRLSLAEAVERSGLHLQTVQYRVRKRGMSFEEALTAPKER